MTNIIDNADIAEALGLDDDDEVSDLTATEQPSEAESKIEFFVQMNGHTMRDMEAAIIEAAARMVLMRNRYDHEGKVEKRIQEAVIQHTTEALNKRLATLTAEIIGQPIVSGGKEVMTVGEAIGLFGREYLTAVVDSEGKTKAERGGNAWGFRAEGTRIEHIVRKSVEAKFKSEISSAMTAIITETRAHIKANADAFLKAERKRIADALMGDASKVTS